MTEGLAHTYTLEDRVLLVQEGNRQLQNDLLTSYQPFIAKTVSEVCKRYIDPTYDDEYSIGLFAFNEAILKYSPGRGSSFLSFANLVVKRKIIDYIRQTKKHSHTMSFHEVFEEEEQMENPLEVVVACEQYRRRQDTLFLREELNDFTLKLKPFKISLQGLKKTAPKHKDARESAVRNARILFGDPVLHAYVCKKKRLPIQALSKKVAVSKKTLERNRKFILAVFIVLNEDYLYLQDYLKGIGTQAKKDDFRHVPSPQLYRLVGVSL